MRFGRNKHTLKILSNHTEHTLDGYIKIQFQFKYCGHSTLKILTLDLF